LAEEKEEEEPFSPSSPSSPSPPRSFAQSKKLKEGFFPVLLLLSSFVPFV
jgi:hypothetical protein